MKIKKIMIEETVKGVEIEGVEISELSDYLRDLNEDLYYKGYKNIYVRLDAGYNNVHCTIEASREETDKEYEKRVNSINKNKEKKKLSASEKIKKLMKDNGLTTEDIK